MVLNNALHKGKFHGFLASIGHGSGIMIYAICAIIGIDLLNNNLFLFKIIKILLILYLFYLGITSIKSDQNTITKIDFSKNTISFLQGLSMAMLNPKVFVWFMAIFSHFISGEKNLLFNILLVLIAGFVDMFWYIILTLFSTSKFFLETIKHRKNTIQKFVGISFIFFGIILIFDLIF